MGLQYIVNASIIRLCSQVTLFFCSGLFKLRNRDTVTSATSYFFCRPNQRTIYFHAFVHYIFRMQQQRPGWCRDAVSNPHNIFRFSDRIIRYLILRNTSRECIKRTYRNIHVRARICHTHTHIHKTACVLACVCVCMFVRTCAFQKLHLYIPQNGTGHKIIEI